MFYYTQVKMLAYLLCTFYIRAFKIVGNFSQKWILYHKRGILAWNKNKIEIPKTEYIKNIQS